MTTVDERNNTSRQPLDQLPRLLEQHDGFADALNRLREGERAAFDGAWGSSCALVAAALVPHAPKWVVLVRASQDEADRLADDIRLFGIGRPLTLPAWESEPDRQQVDDEIYGQRLRTLKALGQSTQLECNDRSLDRLIVTSIQSLMQPVPNRDVMSESTRALAIGEIVDIDRLRHWLVEHGFHGTSAVELPGEFSARGGILDVFAADWDQPVRIELFGDTIESIRRFDIATQRSVESLDEIQVTVLRPDRATESMLVTHLDSASWIVLIEPEDIQLEAARYYEHLPAGHACHAPDTVLGQLMQFPLATVSAIAQATEETSCHLFIESIERFSGDPIKVRDELDRIGTGHETLVIAKNNAEQERLTEIFDPTDAKSNRRLKILVGDLHAGFRLVNDRVILVSGAELFQRTDLPRVSRRRLGRVIDSFLDLTDGDLVVHLAHGIGRYRGMKMLRKNDKAEEHLEIEFHEGTRIYVPATKIDLVQKYIGGTKSRPKLARVGGKSWVRQKQAAEAAVTDLAADMLGVQATRQSRPGIAFPADSDWQHEFDTSFPYQETEDQIAAIAAVKQDMLTARPMDRLLCGDVGFGKTEVAMRAAFKAVDSGYQVAILVPTTILAEQHFRTFRQRMAEFPIDIERLSRFCTARQQREILARLELGQIDILIGTHRLVSRDVHFHNLGLVIIDEEQRFGVQVKERLKHLRSTVDVMTMTATPIPRTLHMSLVGVRDISNLETPPEDRMAVETRVARFNHTLVRDAILRELGRGGQVFFVHNRVQDIEQVAAALRQLVPEASIRVGHGQMPETDLENVMVDFVANRFDVLLATTIVESGLDIPNANTIFIDEANRYGLADLHQLRGRVGRYKHRAYCYLLVRPDAPLTPNAARRLRAIEEFSEMGAGFAISMRDLEIRGAGSLLGTQQSGHIASVGYELYCQLLERAVRRLQHLPPKLSIDVDIRLPGEAYFPSDYVPDLRSKIDLYRRMTRVAALGDLEDIRAELLDRFGPLPNPVAGLLAVVELKIEAAIWQIAAIGTEDDYVVFHYTDRRRMEQLANRTDNRLRIVDPQTAYLAAASDIANPKRLRHLVKSVLRSGA